MGCLSLPREEIAPDRSEPAPGASPSAARIPEIEPPEPEPEPQPLPTGEVIGRALLAMGVRRAYGIVGGGVARLISGLQSAGLQLIHTRHESGAVFMAAEEYHATGTPAVAFTTTGPGLTNALTGIAAASWESAKIFVLAGATSSCAPHQPFQATGDRYLGAIRTLCAPQTSLNASYPRSASELYRMLDLWRASLDSTSGVVNVGLVPQCIQAAQFLPHRPRPAPFVKSSATVIAPQCLQSLADTLSCGSTVIWIGFGARGAAGLVQQLAEKLDARVMSSPRGKGIFPESHPCYIGVSGFAGHQAVQHSLRTSPPANLLILGTRLSEFTTFWNPDYSPTSTVVHVDTDPNAFCYNFLKVPTLGIQQDISRFIEELLPLLPERPPARPRRQSLMVAVPPPGERRAIHPAYVMSRVQREVIDQTEAPVMAEAGNSFAWACRALTFDTPRYRVSTSFGSMGHFACGVVGAALGRKGPALAIVGDGSMLMNNEVSTAVQYKAHAIWVVLNDSGFGMIKHGAEAIGLPDMEVGFQEVDFVAWAEAQGATAIAVECPEDLAPALRRALEADGPVVIDVKVDPAVAPPFGARNESLGVNSVESTGEAKQADWHG